MRISAGRPRWGLRVGQKAEEERGLGVDLDGPTLEWGRERYVSGLGEDAQRLTLLQADVLEITEPTVDVVAAQNFSYSVFKTRTDLVGYFRQVRRSLGPEGLFFLDAYGGTDAICEDEESRRIEATRAFDGTKVPSFVYTWSRPASTPSITTRFVTSISRCAGRSANGRSPTTGDSGRCPNFESSFWKLDSRGPTSTWKAGTKKRTTRTAYSGGGPVSRT